MAAPTGRDGGLPGGTDGTPGGGSEESAGTLAVVPDEAGFALMRRYPSFRFADHPAYLRHAEAQLRAMARRHGYTGVTLFDPADFAEWCEREALDPDTPASRARYAGEVAVHGATVAYRGQPLSRLLPALLAEHERWLTWEVGTDLLAAAGGCPGCGEPLAHCAFQRATDVLGAVLEGAGPGRHHLVCSLTADTGTLTAGVHARLGPGAAVRLPEPDALVLCTVLAAGLATGRPGGLVLRSGPPPDPGRERGPDRDAPDGTAAGPSRVRGWGLRGGRLAPLGAAAVRTAYRIDARTGSPLPPEADVTYHDAPALPPSRCPGAPPPA